jgi:drug/metabolite transporter (DMT)-like permease
VASDELCENPAPNEIEPHHPTTARLNPFMYVFCLLAWGLNFIAIKLQGHTVALELSLLYRLTATALVFVVLAYVMKPAQRPQRGDGVFLFGFGLLNQYFPIQV